MATGNWFEGFESHRFDVNGVQIHARVPSAPRGSKPALFLLYGFPQTYVLW